MISDLHSLTPNIQVMPSNMPYITGVNSGQLRWNTQYGYLEVSSGDMWQKFKNTAAISLAPEVDDILAWAKQEMTKSKRIAEAATRSATVADALATYTDAAEKLQIIMALVEKESL